MATHEPMMAGVAGRYASALYELATESNAVADVEANLSNFKAALAESADLRRLVRSPVFTVEEQQSAISAIGEAVGVKGLAANFLSLVARNRRLFAVPEMIEAYQALAAEGRGEVSAQVTTAVALDDAQTAALKDALRLSAGKDVTLDVNIDPSLLGGLVVKMGSRMIDSSLRTKLATLKTRMKEVR